MLDKDLSYFETLALEAAWLAGDAIMHIYNQMLREPENRHSDIRHKADGSPVTRADLNADWVIRKKLSESGFEVISEENSDKDWNKRKNLSTFWLVDPLDGTREFISQNGEFTVNIALIENQLPILGVMLAPALNQSWSGFGKICRHYKQKQLTEERHTAAEGQTDRTAFPSGMRVLASRSHPDRQTLSLISDLEKQFGSIRLINRGSALKIAELAMGEADFYPRFGPTWEWDTAAGHAILRAAGGEIFDMSCRQRLLYNKPDMLNPSFAGFRLCHDAARFFSGSVFVGPPAG